MRPILPLLVALVAVSFVRPAARCAADDAPAPAPASPTPGAPAHVPDEKQRADAAKHFEQGELLREEGKWAAAAKEYGKSLDGDEGQYLVHVRYQEAVIASGDAVEPARRVRRDPQGPARRRGRQAPPHALRPGLGAARGAGRDAQGHPERPRDAARARARPARDGRLRRREEGARGGVRRQARPRRRALALLRGAAAVRGRRRRAGAPRRRRQGEARRLRGGPAPRPPRPRGRQERRRAEARRRRARHAAELRGRLPREVRGALAARQARRRAGRARLRAAHPARRRRGDGRLGRPHGEGRERGRPQEGGRALQEGPRAQGRAPAARVLRPRLGRGAARTLQGGRGGVPRGEPALALRRRRRQLGRRRAHEAEELPARDRPVQEGHRPRPEVARGVREPGRRGRPAGRLERGHQAGTRRSSRSRGRTRTSARS